MHLPRTAASLILAAGLVLARAGPVWAGPLPPGSQGELVASGGPLFASFVSQSAGLASELWFFGSASQGPTNTPDVSAATFLFANNGAAFTGYAPAAGRQALLYSPPPIGGLTTPALGNLAPGTPLVFGLYVRGLTGGDAANGRWFYTGAGTANVDGQIHAKLRATGAGTVQVGFEDLCRGGAALCAGDRPAWNVDWDYNDHVFGLSGAAVSTTPEPVTMALLGTGLLGFGVLFRRRRPA